MVSECDGMVSPSMYVLDSMSEVFSSESVHYFTYEIAGRCAGTSEITETPTTRVVAFTAGMCSKPFTASSKRSLERDAENALRSSNVLISSDPLYLNVQSAAGLNSGATCGDLIQKMTPKL